MPRGDICLGRKSDSLLIKFICFLRITEERFTDQWMSRAFGDRNVRREFMEWLMVSIDQG